jgi:uncharacterized protein with von Willebrand factor type A (vWA) domain
MDGDQVYWALRTILVSRMDEIAAFDDCFWQFWNFRLPHPTSPGLPSHGESGVMRYSRQRGRVDLSNGGQEEAGPPRVSIVRTGASPIEVMASRDLTALQRNDLAEVSQIAARMIRALPARPGRRRRRHRRKGVPDLRGALRLSLSHDGELIMLPRRRRVPRIPRFLVLLDVSGSMDRHVGLLLQLIYALEQQRGRVETFVFSTSLTRVTRDLKAPSFSEALRRVGNAARHWSGGTRIGECLGTLNDEYAHLLDRNTSVFLLSDGWETGDPDRLARELARLRKQVRRLVWLNPLLGTPDYEPLSLGLQVARSHVDIFASALDLAHLKRLPGLLRG